jgi:hypothetical protein
MTGQVKRTKSSGNFFLFLNFRELVEDEALDELFYPESERIKNTILNSPSDHPLHPKFVCPPPRRKGLLAEPEEIQIGAAKLQEKREQRVESQWCRVREHRAYEFVASNLDYQRAERTFKRLKRRQRAAYGHLYADFQFVRICVWHVSFFMSFPGRSTAPTSKERAAALRHINALLGDMTERHVGFDDFLRNTQLAKTLEALRTVLTARTRRPRQDDARPFRDFNITVAEDLLRTFGVASPEIVKHLARAVGCTLDERTIESHVEVARTRTKST